MALKRKTNLREIAKSLGISASTVSRALRELPGIHPETRKQIIEAAQKLSYRGGELPVPKRFSNVLTLSLTVYGTSGGDYRAGMSTASVELNVSLLSHHYRPDEAANALKPELQPRALAAGQVNGIILTSRWPIEVARALRRLAPIVAIMHEYPDSDIDTIAIDDRTGMNKIVGHLIATGCKKIGFFGLCPQISWARSRFTGYVDAMMQHGQRLELDHVVEASLDEALSEDPFESQTSIARARELAQSGVDAFVCPSETIARSIYNGLIKAGIRVPEDVSITGFHSPQPQPFGSNTVVTSTESSSLDLGAVALERLMNKINRNETGSRTVLLPCRLFPGNTTRPA